MLLLLSHIKNFNLFSRWRLLSKSSNIIFTNKNTSSYFSTNNVTFLDNNEPNSNAMTMVNSSVGKKLLSKDKRNKNYSIKLITR